MPAIDRLRRVRDIPPSETARQPDDGVGPTVE